MKPRTAAIAIGIAVALVILFLNLKYPAFFAGPVATLITFLVTFGVCAWAGLLQYRRDLPAIRRKRGECPHCGYNLTGNVSGVCPECGQKPSGTRD